VSQFNPGLQTFFAWIGPTFVVTFFMGFLLAGLLPPTNPEAGADEIARFFADHATAIRIGCVLMCVGLTLFAPWGAALATWTRRQEMGFPLLTYTQLLALAACVALLVLLPVVWAVAAYRPQDTDPDVTRMLNDLAWFLFLFIWPPFSLWTGTLGIAILRDRNPVPTFPRWTGYLSLWCAALLIPAGLMAFFKDGPMAYDGIVAFYLPLTVFFIWVLALSWAMLANVRRLVLGCKDTAEPETDRRQAWTST